MALVGVVQEVSSGVSDVGRDDLVLVRFNPTKTEDQFSEFLIASQYHYALLGAHVDHASAAAAVTAGISHQTVKPYVKEGN